MFANWTKLARWLLICSMFVLLGFLFREEILLAGIELVYDVRDHNPQGIGSRQEMIPAEPALLKPTSPEKLLAADDLVQLDAVQEKTTLAAANAFAFLEPSHFQAVEVMATGYYAGVESTGKSPGHPEYGITFSGVKVRKSLFSTIAADPAVFPLGTILYIPGYGYGVVADTGNAIKGHKIDLFYETKKHVYEKWGKKKVKVSVLKRGDGKVTEDMLDRLNDIEKNS